ncbi:MAG: hypothetical protein ACKOJB_13490, partial [Chthoniobacterales bacterium]
MTSWFKKNPFLAVVLVVAALVLVAGIYLLTAEAGRLGEEQSLFDQKKSQLQQLQRNKPLPNQANVQATRKEVEEAASLLRDLAKELAVAPVTSTPQAFQDELAGLVKAFTEKAAAKKVALPDNFYLGFEQYETQLPPADIVSRLSLQLRSINAVANVLLDSQVKSLTAIVRSPVNDEAIIGKEAEEPAEAREDNSVSDAPKLELVPFDIAFSADQSALRTAFNRVADLKPPVFIRLVAIENSSTLPPSKTA